MYTYVYFLLSTVKTKSEENRLTHPAGVPDPHPRSVDPFKNGPVSDEAEGRVVLDELVNSCQRHAWYPKGCCKESGQRGEFKGRFNFSQDCRNAICLEFDELNNGKVEAKIITKSHDGNISMHCRLALSHSREAVHYLVKYTSKGKKRSIAAAGVFKRTISSSDDQSGKACTILREIFLKTVGERSVSAQETSHLLLRGKLAPSSFAHVRVVADSSSTTRQLNLKCSGEQYGVKRSMQDAYAAQGEVVVTFLSVMGRSCL